VEAASQLLQFSICFRVEAGLVTDAITVLARLDSGGFMAILDPMPGGTVQKMIPILNLALLGRPKELDHLLDVLGGYASRFSRTTVSAAPAKARSVS